MTTIDEGLIETYLEHYDETQGLVPERLHSFGEQYREQGHLTREQLYELAYESSTRSAYHVESNPKPRCRTVTANVLLVDDDFSKLQLLTGLRGFKAPTASCVVAAYAPDRHAIVDTRVWATLERFGHVEGRKESFSPEDYITMIRPIREIASETGYTTEEVGYALFAYDDNHREGTLH
jgi:thermostable 8-oxoguanine DNA glycosylase